jgi:hypothetical protein
MQGMAKPFSSMDQQQAVYRAQMQAQSQLMYQQRGQNVAAQPQGLMASQQVRVNNLNYFKSKHECTNFILSETSTLTCFRIICHHSL